jgi:hypothetical protein
MCRATAAKLAVSLGVANQCYAADGPADLRVSCNSAATAYYHILSISAIRDIVRCIVPLRAATMLQ